MPPDVSRRHHTHSIMSSKEVKKSGATHGDAAPRDPADDASATLKIQNSTAALPLQSLSSSMTDLQSRHYSSRPLQSIEGRQWHTPPPSSSSWQHNDHGGGDGGSPRRHSSFELARDSSFDSQSLSPPSGCKRMIFSPVDSPSTGGQYQRSVVPAVNSREEEEEEEMRLSLAKKCKLRDVFEQCDEQFPVQQLRHPQHQQQRQQQLRRQTLGRGTGNIGNLRSLDSAQRNRIEQRDKTTMTTSAAVTATTTTANAATNTALKNTTVDNVKLVMADALTTSRKQQNSIIIQQHLNNHNSREHPFHNPQHNIQIRIRQNDESESAKGVNWNYDCDHTHDNTIILHDNNNYDHGNTTNYNNTALFNNSNNDNGDECTNPPHFWEGPYFYCLCTSLFLRCLHVICTPHVHPPCCHSQRRQRERQSPTSQHLDHHHFNTPEHHHSNETRRIHKLSIFTLHRRIPPHKRRILCRSLIITFMIITITFTLLDLLILHKYLNVWLASTLDWLHSHPIAGGVAFIGVFLVGSLSFFPVALLTLGAGYVYIDLYGLFFGILIAFFVCYSGYLLGAAVCFMRSRYLMRRLILKFSNRYPIVRAVDRAFGTMGFRLFLLLRLSPAMPFNALNYIGGITAIKFKDYWWATSVGVVPGLIWTIFVGATFGTVDQRGVDGNKEFDENAVRKGVVLGLGIGLGVLGLVGTGIYARRELTKIVMAEQMEILREEEEEEQHLQQRLQSMENGGVVSISVGDSGVDDDDPSTGKVSLTTSSQNSMVMEDLENSNRSFAEVQEGDDYYDEHHHEELMDSFDDEGVWNYQSEASGVSLGREHFMTPRETISSPSSGSPTENATTIRNTPIRPRPWTPELVVSELPILPNIFRRLSGVPSVDLDFNNGNENHTTPLRMAFSEGISRTESTGGLPSTTMATNTTPFRFQSPPPNRRRANSDTVAFTSDPTTRVSASPFSLGVGLNLTPLKNYDEMIGLANIDEQTVLSFARQHGDFDNKMQTPSSTGKNRVNRKRSNTDPTVAIAKVDDVEKMEKSNLMTLPKSTSSTSTSSSSLWTPIKTFGMKKRHSATSLNELKKDSENGNDDSLPRSLSSSERLPPPTNILADGSSDSNDGSKSKNIITTPTPKRQTRSRPTTPTPSQEANFTRHNRRHTVQLSPSGNHLEVSLGNGDDDVDAQQGREDREWFWIWA